MSDGLTKLTKTRCPVCKAFEVASFFEMPNLPVLCNRLWPTKSEALSAARGDLRLGCCKNCGFIHNQAFDPKRVEYTPDYENSLFFSPRFQEHAKTLATRLVDRHDLHQKQIIEIGCGRGDFLGLLCSLGGNRGIGFDPGGSNGTQHNLTIVRDYYSERYAGYEADFVCCRHVLEHVPSPRAFINGVRRALDKQPQASVYFEVPNANYTLQETGIWDLTYEHCSYFSAGSLARLFESCGFAVDNVEEAFGGQFLGLEAHPDAAAANEADHLADEADGICSRISTFQRSSQRKIAHWQRVLDHLQREGKKAVAWGGGSKGITFLNMLAGSEAIEYVVDLNPRKHGKFISGTGQVIVPPQFLQEYRPDVVIVMNPIYQDEIRQMVGELSLRPEFLCVSD